LKKEVGEGEGDLAPRGNRDSNRGTTKKFFFRTLWAAIETAEKRDRRMTKKRGGGGETELPKDQKKKEMSSRMGHKTWFSGRTPLQPQSYEGIHRGVRKGRKKKDGKGG